MSGAFACSPPLLIEVRSSARAPRGEMGRPKVTRGSVRGNGAHSFSMRQRGQRRKLLARRVKVAQKLSGYLTLNRRARRARVVPPRNIFRALRKERYTLRKHYGGKNAWIAVWSDLSTQRQCPLAHGTFPRSRQRAGHPHHLLIRSRGMCSVQAQQWYRRPHVLPRMVPNSRSRPLVFGPLLVGWNGLPPKRRPR